MKHNIKKRIAAVICSFALAAPTVTGIIPVTRMMTANALVDTTYEYYNGNTYHKINLYPFYPMWQSGQYNGWQTIITQLTNYKYNYTPSLYEFQNLANNYQSLYGSYPLGNENPNLDVSITPDGLRYFVYNYFGNNVTLVNSRITNYNLMTNLSNDKPVILYMTGVNNNTTHALLVTACLSSNGQPSGLSYLQVFDPYDGVFRYIAAPSNQGTLYYTRADYNSYVWSNTVVLENYSENTVVNEVDLSSYYTRIYQGYDTHYCWAASGATIFRRAFNDPSITMDDIVYDLRNQHIWEIDPSNQDGSILDLEQYYIDYQNVHGTLPNMEKYTANINTLNGKIISQLNNGRALYLRIQKSTTSNYHAVVCVGYKQFSDGSVILKIFDPADSLDLYGIYWTSPYNSYNNTFTIADSNISNHLNYGTLTVDQLFYVEYP